MKGVAAATRQEKEKWLLQPIGIASTVAWFGCIFGFVYYYFGFVDLEVVVVGLCAALGVIAGLLLWGTKRIADAAHGRI